MSAVFYACLRSSPSSTGRPTWRRSGFWPCGSCFAYAILRQATTQGGLLNDSQGDNKTIWTFPDRLPCLGLVIVWDSTTGVITELPPLSLRTRRQTAGGSQLTCPVAGHAKNTVLVCGSTKVTQKLDPHLASSASTRPKLAEGRGLLTGSPLTLTWGMAEVSVVCPLVFASRSAVVGACDTGTA